MGDILNIAAVHDAGAPRFNVGIRGNRFTFEKSDNVVYLVDKNGDRLSFDASLILTDGTSAETRIVDAETLIASLEDTLDHLYEMVTTDEYWAGLEADDGVLLVDDDTGYPIIDDWTVCGAIDDLRTRVYALETMLWDYDGRMADMSATITQQNAQLNVLTDSLKAQTKLLGVAFRDLAALKTNVESALNHRFLVDDS